jgi:hypothetical protein
MVCIFNVLINASNLLSFFILLSDLVRLVTKSIYISSLFIGLKIVLAGTINCAFSIITLPYICH